LFFSYRLFASLSESGAKAPRAGTGDVPLQKTLARSTGTTGSQVLPPPLGMSPANVSASSLADRKSVTPGTEKRKEGKPKTIREGERERVIESLGEIERVREEKRERNCDFPLSYSLFLFLSQPLLLFQLEVQSEREVERVVRPLFSNQKVREKKKREEK
jgi:hypothetical protein